MAQNLLAGETSSSSSQVATTKTTTPKQSPASQRLQVLRLKRQDLEKKLQEKNSLLQELCRKEAHLIGVYPTVTVAGQEGHHNPSSSADDIALHGGGAGLSGGKGGGHSTHSTHSLPRKIGTGFTLSEKYLNKRTPSANSPLNAAATSSTGAGKEEDELNSLLLQRDIQQQICKASLKLLNDVALTKSVRRKHKHSYELAQQKLMDIGKGLTTIQKKKQDQYSAADDGQRQQQTMPLTVKTNFKVPLSPYASESPVLDRHSMMMIHPSANQKRNRHDSYNPNHHSPGSYAADGHKGLYRSTSSSSSLNNAAALGKSSLSLDNGALLHGPAAVPASTAHHQPPQQPQGQAKPTSYESKSLHNFVMSSPNHHESSFPSPHHHPALLSPTLYHHTFAMASTRSAVVAPSQHHYAGNTSSLRHQQQQFMSPPQQVVIPQSGLGGYWTLNEHNERVWCASSAYSPGSGSGAQQRFATVDRKAAIYVPNSSTHGKLKMPSPEASPTCGHPSNHLQAHSQFVHDVASFNSGKSYSIPKSTSLGNIEVLHVTTSAAAAGSRRAGEADTASLGSFGSDTNNNPSVYHNLVAGMGSARIAHYAMDEDDDNNNVINNGSGAGPPPPLRPKSSASQHAPERSWYETSLDKAAAGGGSDSNKGQQQKPPALLPRESQLLLQPPPQLHIDIPVASPVTAHQQSLLMNQQPPLERSMSHRIAGSNYVATSPPPPPLPPVTRQHSMSAQHPHQQHYQQDALHSSRGGGHALATPMSPHKKSHHGNNNGAPSAATASNNGHNNVANNAHNNNNMNAVRRSQSNTLIMGGGGGGGAGQPKHSSLISPRLVNDATGAPKSSEEPSIQVESPKNVTVVQQGKFQPYKEESKPFEMSDFYKYSTKFRQQGATNGHSPAATRTSRASSSMEQQHPHHSQTSNARYTDMVNNNAAAVAGIGQRAAATMYGQSGATSNAAPPPPTSTAMHQQHPITYQQ